VVCLVAVPQPLQNLGGLLHAGLTHLHRLETPLQGGVLLHVTPTSWRDLEQGHHHHLAAAELRRLGVGVPPEWSDERT